MPFCMSCGKEVPDQARFCYHCGANIEPRVSGPETSNSLIKDSVVTGGHGGVNIGAPALGGELHIGSETVQCKNCINIISDNNKAVKCCVCGDLFCETCEGYYRSQKRSYGDKPFCQDHYIQDQGEPDKKEGEEKEEDTEDIAEIFQMVAMSMQGLKESARIYDELEKMNDPQNLDFASAMGQLGDLFGTIEKTQKSIRKKGKD